MLVASPRQAVAEDRTQFQGVIGQLTPLTQTAPAVVTLDADRFFRESAWGRAVIAALEVERDNLAAENRRIEEALQKEEQALTERRSAVPAADFSRIARDFDMRVEGIRRAQDTKSQALIATRDAEQRAFFAAAGPVLRQVMMESGASAILASGAVLMAVTEADITAAAIERMDATHPKPLPVPTPEPVPAPQPPASPAPEVQPDPAP
ncbi:OmpH family outer membrane protein [Xinfangfangia sp. CPCC 101601]|uniref:OmpH family outer membrane protein n=1 Tax=Pseudogemmobacter lacusdianii TaxID=3069608 RepID=A0ABU0W1X6_9RHOB|nr:OmpH family outer membrane protein [Xinfangfangia sp. CPCC 101601]MDQ2068013.1 OmpH family outer membrane protein [Xinfangfangia sp. CPCC 101601]